MNQWPEDRGVDHDVDDGDSFTVRTPDGWVQVIRWLVGGTQVRVWAENTGDGPLVEVTLPARTEESQ